MQQRSRFLSRLAADTAGNTLALAAAAVIPFMLVVGSGMDLAVAYMARGKLQNACDAGVLAGRQLMEGNTFNSTIEDEAERFFEFNFPEGTAGATEIDFNVAQDEDDTAQLIGSARAVVPTSLMRIAGFGEIPISVNCDAKRDLGHNDIMLVLDVTGSMAQAPSQGGGTKIGRLRTGAAGIYRALAEDNGSVIRFGIVPYSHTVNVGRSLSNHHILVQQPYVRRWKEEQCEWKKDRWGNSYQDCKDVWMIGTKTFHIKDSSWTTSGNNIAAKIKKFRESGWGCIEERPSVGNSLSPYQINKTIKRADIDSMAPTTSLNEASNTFVQSALQFGRYDPAVQEQESQDGCPAEATPLQTYADEDDFQEAIDDATSRVTGGTYHDVGMLWGTRFISRTGLFSATNPAERDGVPVNQHIVFMTDGMLDTGDTLYSAHGVEKYQSRTQGGGSLDERHLARFASACSLARSMGITVWVIALDVEDTDDVEDCATSPDHFYTSDGSDLQQVFENIGRGIGNLRLTR